MYLGTCTVHVSQKLRCSLARARRGAGRGAAPAAARGLGEAGIASSLRRAAGDVAQSIRWLDASRDSYCGGHNY